MLTQARLQQLLRYDRRTGVFRKGMRAGTQHVSGCWYIRLNGKVYLAHRLAWLYVYGYVPKQTIDHKNRNNSDNRIVNLRVATKGQNRANSRAVSGSSSGLNTNWYAQITHNNKRIYLGRFATPQAAHAAYCKAAKKLHGEFFRKA